MLRIALPDSLIDLGELQSKVALDGIRLFWTKKRKYEHMDTISPGICSGSSGGGRTGDGSIFNEKNLLNGGIALLVQKS